MAAGWKLSNKFRRRDCSQGRGKNSTRRNFDRIVSVETRREKSRFVLLGEEHEAFHYYTSTSVQSHGRLFRYGASISCRELSTLCYEVIDDTIAPCREADRVSILETWLTITPLEGCSTRSISFVELKKRKWINCFCFLSLVLVVFVSFCDFINCVSSNWSIKSRILFIIFSG